MSLCAVVATLSFAPAASAQTATQDIAISATVPKACTINNAATGTLDHVTIPINANGSVNTAPITPAAYTNVACNGPSTLLLTSLSGGVLNPTTATNFANIIDYSALATWNSVTASINTATTPGAAGAESGTPVPVATAFAGPLNVTINPTSNVLPLVQGAYTDTLRITLVPQ